jgi:hypothetical protein
MPARRSPLSRTPVLLAIVALHAALLLVWQASRRDAPSRAPEEAMQWVWIAPPSPKLPAPSARPPERPRPAAIRLIAPPAAPAPVATPEAPLAAEPAPPPVQSDDPFSPPAPELSRDVRALARGAAGKVDQQLRKESARRAERASVMSEQYRFGQELERRRLAQSTEQSGGGSTSVEEVHLTGITADRVSKVRTPFGTYCMRQVHPNVGIDRYERERNSPKMVSCPR